MTRAEADPDTVVVAVCTYNRPRELAQLLERLAEYGASRWHDCRIGVTVVDDSADGNARALAEGFAGRFPLGLVYAHSGARNISVARNLALESSLGRGDWVAMTDDDCEPSEQWLAELVRVRRASGAEVVTGLMLRRAPAHAPRWIREQPFLELGEFDALDGEELPVAQTNNSLVSSEFLKARPELRFDPAFGRIGGEDMAFFHAMKRAGARIVYAAKAFVYENEPDERLTVRYQLRRYFWHGNSSVVTSLERGTGRGRLVVHAGGTLARAVRRPLARLARGERPQWLFAGAQAAEGLGKLAGTMGIRINHK
jgi:succinoglycan biosynthesis protein ExoM